jgi:hypothetical protein
MYRHPSHLPVVYPRSAPAYSGAAQVAGTAAGVAAIAGIALLPTFVVGPLIVKVFAPDWGYGRRLGATLAFGVLTGTAVTLIRAARGTDK